MNFPVCEVLTALWSQFADLFRSGGPVRFWWTCSVLVDLFRSGGPVPFWWTCSVPQILDYDHSSNRTILKIYFSKILPKEEISALISNYSNDLSRDDTPSLAQADLRKLLEQAKIELDL